MPTEPRIRATTILAVRKAGRLVLVGDGQVSFGDTVMKGNARKVRRFGEGGRILAGFAGATADAFTLFERLEQKLERFPGNLQRASVELAKDWRTDRYLRNLEAMIIVGDAETLLVITGRGDVLEPEHPVTAIGSGGNFALAAARALYDLEFDAEEIARRAMKIAGEICVYTNHSLVLEQLDV
ncbi:ATP-dependent protease subunit HslV [bacterium]|nr:ATP-dependent protease subunit HslV [bacterium]